MNPCPRCYALYLNGKIRGETVMPLPELCPPRAIYGQSKGRPCCQDCASADTLIKIKWFQANRPPAEAVQRAYNSAHRNGEISEDNIDGKITERARLAIEHDQDMSFLMSRIVVGNDRQKDLRLPGIAALVRHGFMRPSSSLLLSEHAIEAGVNPLDWHHTWLDKYGIEPGDRPINWSSIERDFPEAAAKWDRYCAKHKLPIDVYRPRLNVKHAGLLQIVLVDDEDQAVGFEGNGNGLAYYYRAMPINVLAKGAIDKIKADRQLGPGEVLPSGEYAVNANDLVCVMIWDWVRADDIVDRSEEW